MILAPAFASCRQACMGVGAFAQSQPAWDVRLRMLPTQPAPDYRNRRPDGVLLACYDRTVLNRYRRLCDALKIPMVSTIYDYPSLACAKVLYDEQAIGGLAAKHLLERGFGALAFVGSKEALYSDQRRAGFAREAERARVVMRTYTTSTPRPELLKARRFRDWLSGLSRPTRLMAMGDFFGMHIVEVIRGLGLRVPEDIAVIGVDNDDICCALSRPQLSSVMVPAHAAGFEAARMLDVLMRQEGASPLRSIRLAPLGVRLRGSSDVFAYRDAAVSAALSLIHDDAQPGRNIDEILRQVGVARRTLFRKFKVSLGRTPFEELRRTRFRRACRMLRETTYKLGTVSERAGYPTRKRMLADFLSQLGQTPLAYRLGQAPVERPAGSG